MHYKFGRRGGGGKNGSFDISSIDDSAQYRGFLAFEKVGNSTWTLAGSTTETTPWTISDGTLEVGDAARPSANIEGSVSVSEATNAYLRYDAVFHTGNLSAQSVQAGVNYHF